MGTKKVVFSIGILALIAIAIFFSFASQRSDEETAPVTHMGTLTLTSWAFKNNEPIPAVYTCEGNDVNPSFVIQGVPETARSLALIMDDPDAIAGTWDHWVVWNIDPKTSEIKENEVPVQSTQGTTSFGDQKYGGPCPPKGTGAHRYRFKLYALDTLLDVLPSARKKDVEEAMEGHIVDQAILTGLYEKK